MSNDIPYLGSKISLISKAEIRYEGILYSIDATESTVALAKVRSFGTEDRQTDHPVQPRDEVFEYIIFRGTDIKDLHVCDTNKVLLNHTPQDPAIVQSSMSVVSDVNSIGGSNVYPFGSSTNSSYPPQHNTQNYYSAYNVFGHQNSPNQSKVYQQQEGSHRQLTNAASAHSDSHSRSTPPNVYRNRKASDSRSPSPPPQRIATSFTNSNAVSNQEGGANDYSSSLLDDKIKTGSNRGGTYNKGKYNGYYQQQQQQQQQNSRDFYRSDYQPQQHKQQHPQHSYLNRDDGITNNNRYNKENYQPQSHLYQQQQQHQQQLQQNYHRIRGGNAVYNPSNNTRLGMGGTTNSSAGGSAVQQQVYDFRSHRGRPMPPTTSNRGWSTSYYNNNTTTSFNLKGSGSNGRALSRGYGSRPGYLRFGRPGILKFDSEFDFESSNAQFDKCQIEKELKEKLKIESKDPSSGDNGLVEETGDEANGGEEAVQSGSNSFYDKNKSFFDSISCEALDKNGALTRTNWKEERKLNFETFGLRSSNGFRGRYRGRGGGSYSRGGYGGMGGGGGLDNGYHSGRGYNNGGGFRGWGNNQYRSGGGRVYRGGWSKQQPQQMDSRVEQTGLTAEK